LWLYLLVLDFASFSNTPLRLSPSPRYMTLCELEVVETTSELFDAALSDTMKIWAACYMSLRRPCRVPITVHTTTQFAILGFSMKKCLTPRRRDGTTGGMVQGAWLFLLPYCSTDLFDGARFLVIGGIGARHVILDGLNRSWRRLAPMSAFGLPCGDVSSLRSSS
jgi:hypothetical protein